jgi:hypothetical protein
MGILDSKKRIMDAVLTPLGREYLARGGLKVSYATITDGQAYYDPSSVTGSYDTANDRIYFESPYSLPHDTLALVTDDTGDLVPASAFGYDISTEGTIYSGGSPVIGLTSGSSFSSAITSVTDMFKTSLGYNMIVASADPLDDTPDFVINPNQGSFYLENSMAERLSVTSINTADSLFFDRRFSGKDQFKYLPPVVSSGKNKIQLGKFKNIKRSNDFTYENLKQEVFGTNSKSVKQRLDIKIQDTSLENDMVVQLFEVTPTGVTKLDAVDFGEVFDSTDRERPQKRIVFFGKVFLDDTETATYANLFTVVFD